MQLVLFRYFFAPTILIGVFVGLSACSNSSEGVRRDATATQTGSQQPSEYPALQKQAEALGSRYAEALVLYGDFEKKHPDMSNLEKIAFNDGYVKLLIRAGQLDKAKERADAAIKDAERSYGPDSTNTQAALATRLAVAEAAAEREKVDEIINQLVAIADRSKDKRKQMRALTLWYSRVSFACGEVVDPARLQNLYELRKEFFGPKDMRVFDTRVSIAQNLANSHKLDESAKAYVSLLQDAKAANAAKDFLINATEKYGKVLFQQGKDSEAQKVWNDALALTKGDVDSINQQLEILSNLGFVHFRKDRYKQAIPFYKQGFDTLEKMGPHGEGDEEIYNRYITCLEKTGDSKTAAAVKEAFQRRTKNATAN